MRRFALKRNTGFRLVTIGSTILLQVLSTSPLLASNEHSAKVTKQEQGEEVYEPNAKNKSHEKKSEDHLAKSAPAKHESASHSDSEETPAEKETATDSSTSNTEKEEDSSSAFEEQDSGTNLTESGSGENTNEGKRGMFGKTKDNIKLKEFTKKVKKKDSASNGKNIQKIQNEKPKAESEKKPIEAKPQAEATEKAEGVLVNDQQDSEKSTAESEIKVEHNKLTEPDDKVVEHSRYKGIIWFFGVFIVLLIVVFAFT